MGLPSLQVLSCVCHVQVNLKYNNLGETGWCALFDALRENEKNSISKWDLSGERADAAIVRIRIRVSLRHRNISVWHL